MTKKTSAPPPEFDAKAFSKAFDVWVAKKGNRQKLTAAMQPALREARLVRQSLEVKPEKMAEAVTF